MAWSPDSHYLAFFGSEYELFVLDLQDKILIHTCIADIEQQFSWSPDSQQIMFYNYKNNGTDIFDIKSMNLMSLPVPSGEPYGPKEWIFGGE
jgi:Tol biopolymer transport system component